MAKTKKIKFNVKKAKPPDWKESLKEQQRKEREKEKRREKGMKRDEYKKQKAKKSDRINPLKKGVSRQGRRKAARNIGR